jgi:hypothetical protein
MWGVFDVVAPQPVQAATRQVASACASLSDGLTPSRVLAASLVSASCGTDLASIDNELAVAANVRAAAALARAGSRGSAPVPLRTVIAARVADPSQVHDLTKAVPESPLLSHPVGASE